MKQDIDFRGLERLSGIKDKLLLPTIQLASTPCNRVADIPLAATKLGGAPDTPEGFQWPYLGDRSLEFICQLNSDEINQLIPGTFASGKLILFFFDFETQPAGHLRSDRSGWAIKVVSLDEKLSRQQSQGVIEFVEEKVKLFLDISISCEDSLLVNYLDFSPKEKIRYFDLVSEIDERMKSRGGDRIHRVLGHPYAVQYDVFAEAYCASTDTDPAQFDADASLDKVFSLYDSWRLVLQLDSLIFERSPLYAPGDAAMWGDHVCPFRTGKPVIA